jgi:geranylgeranyl pyrophosphate synthase
VADYVRMIELKTACLIACAIEVGALLGTNDVRTIQSLRSFGHYLGLAFQIRDDVLGIWGDPTLTGKPVGGDIVRRKKTLPIVYALEKAGGADREAMRRIYSHETVNEEDKERVLQILASLGAEAWAQARAEEYSTRAVAEIAHLSLSPAAQRSLEEMAAFLARREF